MKRTLVTLVMACAALLAVPSIALAQHRLATPGAAAAAAAPDLSISVQGPSAVGVIAPFTEAATVTNQGTAATPGITVSYTTGRMAISPGGAPGMHCTYIQYGHSGRGGGVTTVGESCSQSLASGLAPGQSVTVRLTMTESSAETLNLTFTAAPYPAETQLDQVSHTTGTSVSVVRPPAAAAPTGVNATESGDELNVGWTPASATAPYISNSLITATPTGGSTAPVLTAVVPGTATTATVPGVVGSTAYSITVANNDGGGAGATSQPFLFTSGKATIVPRTPTITYEWGYAGIRWNPPSPGNSAIDRYEVTATGEGNNIISYVSGSATSDYLYPAPADSLAVKIRAHNAAGWGRWSTTVYFYDGGN
jgi:hypothetical protein